MKIDLHSTIKSSKIFASLDEAAIKKLINQFVKIHLKKDQVLFRQGDLSDDLYLVVSGKVVVVVQEGNLDKKVLREVRHGETLGEIAAISHEPRSATAIAMEDTVLLKLAGAEFNALCNEYPKILLQAVNVFVARSRNLIDLLSNNKPIKKNIAILPANEHYSVDKLKNFLKEQAKVYKDVVLLSNECIELQGKYKTEAELHDLIDNLETKNTTILYFIGLTATPLTNIALEKADMVYVVGCGESKPEIHAETLKIINNPEYSYKASPELILLHEKEKKMPTLTMHWLKLANFGLHHHIRLYEKNDCQRLWRFFRGQAVGLVLGGGGVRSWAHIGAIKAILHADLPIDAIGGTSAGSIVGAFYGLHETYEDTQGELQHLTAVTRAVISFRTATWPAISLFDGKDYTHAQRKMFGNARIEDMWLPFFCVSCNLSKSAQVMHRTGLLWKRVRSSTSVPGIFPPVVIRGQIHVDGGIINNLPVDLMKKMTSSIGTIIAVELVHKDVDENFYRFPPVLPLGRVVLAKLGLGYKKYKFPSMIETFLKSLLMGSSIKQKENSLTADILVTPDLSPYDLLRISEKQESELMDIGYMTTIKAINKWRKKHKGRE